MSDQQPSLLAACSPLPLHRLTTITVCSHNKQENTMARSWNHVELIGNLTHDPELRQTAKGTAVCAFGLATNRSWTAETGEKQEETAFHRIVAWKSLAEQCGKLLRKGRRVFVAGRLAYRSYEKDGTTIPVAEIILSDMLLLDDKRPAPAAASIPTSATEDVEPTSEDLAEAIPF
jgi:single-strand DNA-binding protein